MQQGMLIIGSLLGIRHFKWEANANRKAGEMLTLYICPKTEGGTLDAEPCSISILGINSRIFVCRFGISPAMQINPATKGSEKNNADGFAMDTNK